MISLGAQGIPVGGFEPTPLNTGAGAGIASSLGAGTLTSVYDPAIQETQIATGAVDLRHQLHDQHALGPQRRRRSTTRISAGTFLAGPRFPIIFDQDTATFPTGLQKRTATGAVLAVAHNVNYLYSNSPTNVFPSAYTTNTQLQLHPALAR